MRLFGKNFNRSDGKDTGIKSKALSYSLLTIVFIISSCLSFWYIYSHFGNNDILTAMDFLSPHMLPQILGLLLVYYLLDTLRFYYILKTLKCSVSFPYMIKLAFINIFISNITPLATGGGFAQIYFLTKKNIPLGDATAASTIRTMIPMAFFFMAVPVVLVYNQSLRQILPSSRPFIYLIGLALIYAIAIWTIYMFIKDIKKTKAIIYKFLSFLQRRKILSAKQAENLNRVLIIEIENFVNSVVLFFRGNKIDVFMSFALSMLFLLSLFSFPAVLTKALGYNVSLASIIQFQIIVTFITYFAPTPGASGIAEAGFAFIFSGIILAGDMAALTLAWRFFTVYLGVIIGLVVFYTEIIKISFRGDNINEAKL